MSRQMTLSIIKPDAIKKGFEDEINEKIKNAGLRIILTTAKKTLPVEKVKEFYKEHAEKPFFNELVTYMTSGPVIVQVLEGEDAVKKYRALMGTTDPKDAEPGTLRAEFAESKACNAVHGSDSLESAERELGVFFTNDMLKAARRLTVLKYLETTANIDSRPLLTVV